MTIINEQRLPEKVRNSYIPFLKQLLELHGDNAESVFLYGSATGQNFILGASDINSVLIVKSIQSDTLDKSLRLIAGAARKRIAAPLIFTQGHIQSSLDVFPIEFLDMKDQYIVVYGTDPLKDITIQQEHTRLFCEQQLKGKLIRIRQSYLEVGLRKRGIEMLLRGSLNSLIPVFRSLLRIKGVTVPEEKGELLKITGAVFGIDTGVMTAIWNEKKNNERVGGKHAREAFIDYIQALEQLAQAADQL